MDQPLYQYQLLQPVSGQHSNVPDNDDEGIKQTKATSIAEARFLRAFYYYRLFINFGERLPMFEHELRRYRRGILSSSGRSRQTEDFHRDRTE